MKKILLGALLIVSCFAFGQKIKIKDNIALVDGKNYVKVIEDNSVKHGFDIETLNGEKIFYLKHVRYEDARERKASNPQGTVIYVEVFSSDLNTKYFETFNVKEFIKILFNANILDKDSNINTAELETISKKIGSEYSKRRGSIY
ncbi:hypothetical protein ACFQO9_10575 [Chryseobacterium zhengzhouense]|uniref:EF-hand domain-containing protein n=1 Tax=Chryseobacterium zhengzhouense TaxID=1636086 RepID=A0ABW2LX59_9FLAO